MSIEQLGNMGEFVSSIAVVISLIYLALQVRSQTIESRLMATRELATKRADALKQLMSDDVLMEAWIKALRDYESLQGTERMKASLTFHLLMRNAEQEYIHRGTGHADDPYLESVDRVLFENVSSPGLQQWWTTTASLFNSGFQQHVNSLIGKVDDIRLVDSFAVESQTNGDA